MIAQMSAARADSREHAATGAGLLHVERAASVTFISTLAGMVYLQADCPETAIIAALAIAKVRQ